MDPTLQHWYTNLLWAAVVNVVLFAFLLLRAAAPPTAYARRLRLLAAPVVFQCAWRGIFPSLYLQRFAFWDTPLNSILVDRTLACAGEMAWNIALAVVFCHLDGQLHPTPRQGEGEGSKGGGTPWVRRSAGAMVGMYALAEATSYYNTATENELAAAVEVLLDGTSQVLLLPAAVFLFRALPAGKRCRTSAGIFLLAFAAQGLGLFAYNVLVDAPMYWKRYQADQAAGKQYLPFVAGLWDALVHRIPTQQLADWQADMSWMVGYFWGNPLAATLVAWAAPSIRPAAVCDNDEGGYEIVPLTTERGSETAPSVASARGSISMVAEE